MAAAEKTPLKAEIFDRIEREGYSVEKVYFQSYPGFYVAGNLYRPLNKGKGPFPAVLNPHGHWATGRLNDTKEGSIAARCISFARQGMVAFSWDMTGYNDMMQLGSHRQIATNHVNQLWNISLMAFKHGTAFAPSIFWKACRTWTSRGSPAPANRAVERKRSCSVPQKHGWRHKLPS